MSDNDEITNWINNNPYSKTISLLARADGAAIALAYVEILGNEKNLREWQHEVFRKYGKSACYALFLVLPSDEDAISYLSKYGIELHQISGDNVLVFAFSKNNYTIPIAQPSFSTLRWESIVKEYVNEGLSIKVANLFNIKYSEFPCVLLFEDIRASQHVMISIKGLKAEEISERIRETFSVIQKAIKNKEKIIAALRKDAMFKNLQSKGYATISTIQALTQKTLEAALIAWAETTVK